MVTFEDRRRICIGKFNKKKDANGQNQVYGKVSGCTNTLVCVVVSIRTLQACVVVITLIQKKKSKEA